MFVEDSVAATDGHLAVALRIKRETYAGGGIEEVSLQATGTLNGKPQAVKDPLFRAGGFFANQESGDRAKDPSEMTADEIKAAVRKAEASLKIREAEINKPSGGLFD